MIVLRDMLRKVELYCIRKNDCSYSGDAVRLTRRQDSKNYS